MKQFLRELMGEHTGVASDLALALVRVFFGVAMAVNHGYAKIRDVEGFADNALGPAGIPIPQLSAWLVAGGEFIGALLLAVGLLTRFAAGWLLVIMAGAAFYIHGGDGFKTMEPALLFGVVFLFFAIRGGGRFSVDANV